MMENKLSPQKNQFTILPPSLMLANDMILWRYGTTAIYYNTVRFYGQKVAILSYDSLLTLRVRSDVPEYLNSS